jgi:hypothetical protein
MMVCRFGDRCTIFFRRNPSATIAHILRVSIHHYSREIKIMARPVKALATLASLALLASSIFAVSWVGLALLGY